MTPDRKAKELPANAHTEWSLAEHAQWHMACLRDILAEYRRRVWVERLELTHQLLDKAVAARLYSPERLSREELEGLLSRLALGDEDKAKFLAIFEKEVQ